MALKKKKARKLFTEQQWEAVKLTHPVSLIWKDISFSLFVIFQGPGLPFTSNDRFKSGQAD